LNDVVTRALSRAAIPASKEPTGLSREDDKRPDGMTLVPWQSGKLLIWDVTVISTLASSYVSLSSQEKGKATELAATRKEDKYSCLSGAYNFQPLAFENCGAMNESACDFFRTVGNKIARRERLRLYFCLQRFNSILFKDTFHVLPEPDL
jgi:hypothetical protein